MEARERRAPPRARFSRLVLIPGVFLACDFLIFISKQGELQVIHKDTKRKLGGCNINQKVYSSIESYENKIFIQVSDGSLRAYTIKKNGNPDELWNRPFFTGENDKRNNEDWDPLC